MPTLNLPTESTDELTGPLEVPVPEVIGSDTSEDRTKFRTNKRANFPYQLRLIQLDAAEDETPACFTVTGHDYSEYGIGFFHTEPIPFRKARIEAADDRLEILGLSNLSLDITICRCRFIAEGKYESGGRITSQNNS